MLGVALLLHVLATVVWVGGMFFAHQCLRPAAVAVLEPPERLRLWRDTFGRFFPWVWACVVVILGTGLWMMFRAFGGFQSPGYVHAMLAIGLLMMAIFMHIFFAPYRRLVRAVEEADWTGGAKALGQIRLLVGVNLVLGLTVTAVAVGGPHVGV
jgi:uncharacterized membrane protein